jgi:hypothetical protein
METRYVPALLTVKLLPPPVRLIDVVSLEGVAVLKVIVVNPGEPATKV